jgi:uncharacterized protein involved in type VI secretion and phage assembly
MQTKGIVIGTVNKGSNGQVMDDRGRIRLTLPLAEGGTESNWAPVVVPLASKGNGIQFMPEEGNQAVVAFRDDDPRFPVVLGYLWNDEDPPPRDKGEQRTVQTVSGHVLEFDDTQGSEKISLLFKGDFPGITIDQNAVTIKFSETSYIELTSASIKIVNNTLVEINP